LNTGSIIANNNDHVISFDGKWLAISSGVGKSFMSFGWVVPVRGGEPRRLTPIGPSYMHGWSPDGKWIVFCANRNNNYDVYRISSAGGPEERLTTAPGLDDGPEYSPDGKYTYFNSVRSGLMQIWRMDADGSNQTQLTNDDYNNWFPHVSPDGRWISYISFRDVLVKGLPNGDTHMKFNIAGSAGYMKGALLDTTAGHKDIPLTKIEQDSDKVTLYFTAQGYDVSLLLAKKDDDHATGSLMGMFDADALRLKDK
jgi:dipeptidyl aminopeptidase/acylaminoacyl peptidase